MLDGNVLQVSCSYLIEGASNPCINVWHFQVEDMDGASTLGDAGVDITDAFTAKFVNPVTYFQHTGVLYQQLNIINLNDPVEFFVATIDGFEGSAAGNRLPPFVTLSMQEVRPSRAIRSGRKGLGGIAGSITADGLTLVAPAQAQMDTMLSGWNTMATNVEGDVSFTLVDVIVRMNTSTLLPPTLVLPAARWLFSGFGSQNTRK